MGYFFLFFCQLHGEKVWGDLRFRKRLGLRVWAGVCCGCVGGGNEVGVVMLKDDLPGQGATNFNVVKWSCLFLSLLGNFILFRIEVFWRSLRVSNFWKKIRLISLCEVIQTFWVNSSNAVICADLLSSKGKQIHCSVCNFEGKTAVNILTLTWFFRSNIIMNWTQGFVFSRWKYLFLVVLKKHLDKITPLQSVTWLSTLGRLPALSHVWRKDKLM